MASTGSWTDRNPGIDVDSIVAIMLPAVLAVLEDLEGSGRHGLVLVSPSGEVLWIDERALALVGSRPGGLQGVPAASLLHPGDLSHLLAIRESRQQIGGVGNWTEVRLRSTRGWVPAELRDVVLRRGEEVIGHLIQVRALEPGRRSGSSARVALEDLRALESRADADTSSGLLDTVCRLVRDHLGRERAAVWVRVGSQFREVACSDEDPVMAGRAAEVSAVSHLLRRLERGYVGINDREAMGPALGSEVDFLAARSVRSWLAAPLHPESASRSRPTEDHAPVEGWLEVTHRRRTGSASVGDGEFILGAGDVVSRLLDFVGDRFRAGDGSAFRSPSSRAGPGGGSRAVLDRLSERISIEGPRLVACLRVAVDGAIALRRRRDPVAVDRLAQAERAIRFLLAPDEAMIWPLSDGFAILLFDGLDVDNCVSMGEAIRAELEECVLDGAPILATVGIGVRELDGSLGEADLLRLITDADDGLGAAQNRGAEVVVGSVVD